MEGGRHLAKVLSGMRSAEDDAYGGAGNDQDNAEVDQGDEGDDEAGRWGVEARANSEEDEPGPMGGVEVTVRCMDGKSARVRYRTDETLADFKVKLACLWDVEPRLQKLFWCSEQALGPEGATMAELGLGGGGAAHAADGAGVGSPAEAAAVVEDIFLLPGYGALSQIVFSGNGGPFGGQGEPVEMATSMAEADFRYKMLGPAGMLVLSSFLPQCRALTSLDVSSSGIGPQGVAHLAAALRTNGTLAAVDVSGNDVKEEGIRFLIDALQVNERLQSVVVHRARLPVQVLKTAAELDLSSQSLGPLDLLVVAAMVDLNVLVVVLNLSGNEIGGWDETAAMEDLARVLGRHGRLREVNLAWNDMRAADAAVLARGMDKGTTAILTPEGRVLTTLRVLDVSGNALTMARAGGRGGGRDAEEAAGLEHLAGLCQRKGIKLKNGEPAAGPKSPLERHFGPMAFCL